MLEEGKNKDKVFKSVKNAITAAGRLCLLLDTTDTMIK